MAEKITYTKVVSPKAVAVYPHLNKADDKFGDPVFKVTLRVPEDDAQPLVEKVEAMLAALAKGDTTGLREADAKRLELARTGKAVVKGKKVTLTAADPAFAQELAEDGEPTGNTLLKFKASGEFKDKDGNVVKRKIKFIDAGKQPITNPPFVWGGSVLRVRAMLMPWVNAKFEYGVKLGIDLVQIINLVTSGGTTDTSGFDEEDGYTSTTAGSGEDAAGEAGDPGPTAEDGDF
jgi:hypothetical protein